MKKTLAVAMAALCTFAGPDLYKARALECYNVFIYALTGPLKTNAAYEGWADGEVQKLYTVGNLDADDIGHQLLTTNVTQPADDSNTNNLWFAVKIVTRDGTPTLSLEKLMMAEASSDSYNVLSNVYNIALITNAVYSPSAMGVLWNSNGPRAEDTIIDDSVTPGTNLVNEIDFIGMQSKYIQCSPSYTYADADGYLSGNAVRLTGGCYVLNSSAIVLAYGQKTLQYTGSPTRPLLTLGGCANWRRLGENSVNDTIKLYRSPTIAPAVWSFVSTMNTNDIYCFTATNCSGYFRGILE